MKTTLQHQFQKLHSLFRKRQKEIPQHTRGKLLFIASRIFNLPFNSPIYYDSESEEAVQIAQLEKKSMIILFNTLIQTLLLEKLNPERQCKVKFSGFFEFWKDAKVLIQDKYLLLSTQKFTYKYQLIQISIANCRKSKRCFQVSLNNQVIATVKLLTIEIYNEFQQYLHSCIEDCKENSKDIESIERLNKEQFQKGVEIVPGMVSTQQEIAFDKVARDSKRKSFQEEPNIQDMIKKEKLQNFHIIEQGENICIMAANNQPKIHVSLILKSNTDLSKIVNFYLQQKQWNSAILSEEIKQMEENIVEIFRVLKKDSLFEMDRATLTQTTIFCSKNTANITEQTSNLTKKDNKLICNINATTKFYRCLGAVKITIDCSFDGKGYYNPKDSSLMLGKLYSDIKFLGNSLILSQLQKTKLKSLITQSNRVRLNSQHQPYLKHHEAPSNGKMIRISKEEDDGKLQKEDNLGTNDSLENYVPKGPQSSLESLFYKIKPIKPTCIPSLDYIKLVLNLQNQKYYLKHRFDQSIVKHFDSYTPSYCLSQFLRRKEYTINENKELAFIDREVIQGQKDSLLYVIKQVGANLISGKSVLNISLPVDIFQPRSLLERSAADFGLIPDYLLPIADSDPLTQIKNIITIFSTIPTIELIMLKPFNPILGQTFQAYIKGIPIYFQQISHHPPISSFYMTCPEFTFYGNLVAFADLSLNSAVGGNEGITYIKMRNGSEFQCYFPPCQISGLIFGERTFRAYGRGYILEKKQNLFAEFSIEKQKKGLYQKGDQELHAGSLLGGIFKLKPQVMQEIAKQPSLKKFSGITKKDVQSKLAQIKGIWFEQIRIDNQIMNKHVKVYPLEYPKVALPSDSNYRSDVLYHKLRDIPQSQRQKETLEVRQRADRKLREKQAKIQKKNK